MFLNYQDDENTLCENIAPNKDLMAKLNPMSIRFENQSLRVLVNTTQAVALW